MNTLERNPIRLYVMLAVIIAVSGYILFRLWGIQIDQHDYYATRAQANRINTTVIPAKRGSILDRNGNSLAISVSYDVVIAYPSQMIDPLNSAKQLAKILRVPEEQVIAKFFKKDVDLTAPAAEVKKHTVTQPVNVVEKLSASEAERIRQELHSQKLFDIEVKTVDVERQYPEGNLAAHVIGKVSKDRATGAQYGILGVEASLDDELAGRPGMRRAEVDLSGNPIIFTPEEYIPPQDGHDVKLTIDSVIQRIAEEKLAEWVTNNRAAGGSIVIIDPYTGEVLALANNPTFNLADPIDPNHMELYKNPAVSNVYEPGSVFKPTTVSGALETGAITPQTTVTCPGYFDYAGIRIHTATGVAFGVETPTQVLQNSDNVGSAKIAILNGSENFYRFVRAFGFGAPTGIELPGESSGLLRTPESGKEIWGPADLATNAFGQGIGVTPLQMANSIAAIANGGTLMQLHIVKDVEGENSQVAYGPRPIRRVISPETAEKVKTMMVAVAEGGTIKKVSIPGYHTGGKTGTAEIVVPGVGYGSSETIASYVGFAPAEHPRFVMLAKVDRPKASIWGETVAAPLFEAIAKEVLEYMRVPPSVPVQAAGKQN